MALGPDGLNRAQGLASKGLRLVSPGLQKYEKSVV